MMKRIDFRILIGVLLILGGLLMLLDKIGLLPGATGYFWAGLLAVGALVFLYVFFTDRANWWAAFPGFTLAGLSAAAFLPSNSALGGLAFLGGIGLGFWAVYFSSRDRWWAIIPGGVLLTLGFTSALGELNQGITNTGGFFFVGLGLTFLLVALLARMRWAYIPAGVLLVFGLLLGTPFVGLGQYVWIGILLVAGIIMIIAALRSN
jgi:hypothetical protein